MRHDRNYNHVIISSSCVVTELFKPEKINLMNLKKLRKRRSELLNELYDLHHAEANPHMYILRRNEIEHKIVSLEDAIEIEQKMLPFKYMLYVFIGVAVGILVWAYAVSK